MRISEGRGEGEVLRELKLQVPSSKFQARSAGGGLELGTWDFFGVWSLVFGVSIPGFLWSLVFGIGCFLLSPLAQSPSIAYQGTPLPGPPVGFFAIAWEINHQLMSQS